MQRAIAFAAHFGIGNYAHRLTGADDTTAIQALINSAGVVGAKLTFGPGGAVVSDGDADLSCLKIQNAMNVVGAGMGSTRLNPSGVASNVATLALKPAAAYAFDGTSVSNLFLGDYTTGLRSGAHGILIDTTVAGSNAARLKISGVSIGDSGSAAIHHLNSTAANTNGGMYGSVIELSTLRGGIILTESGDSLSIKNNSIAGSGIGVAAQLVTGASLLEIVGNNITNSAGAISLASGSRPQILANNIENSAAGALAANNGAVVNLLGSVATIHSGEIKGNLISAFGASNATTLLRLRNCVGTIIEGNTFLSDGARSQIDIGSDCVGIVVGSNTINAAVTAIVDNGIGTVGVKKAPTLLNSWVNYSAAYGAAEFIKDRSGLVTLSGLIKDGTTAVDTILFYLPVGFRPSKILMFPAYSLGPGFIAGSRVDVYDTGEVTISLGGSNLLTLTGISFLAANLSNTVSSE